MMTLSQKNIADIKKDLTKMGLSWHALQEEILDHICCMIEEKLAAGTDLDSAKRLTYKAFNKEELSKTQQKTKKSIKVISIKRKLRCISGVAACLMLLMVLGADAHDQSADIPHEPFQYNSPFEHSDALPNTQKNTIQHEHMLNNKTENEISYPILQAEEPKDIMKYNIMKTD